MPESWREVPPTAGLPIQWRDFRLRGVSQSLETRLSAFLRVSSVQIECSGTAALIVALTTPKRASGRRSVIMPAYTCPLVALAVLHCGLRPVVCDLLPGSFEICPEALARAANDDTLAIIPTHLGGRVADLTAASDIARRTGAWVIEDAAQALGATDAGRYAGTIADIGFCSLAAGKGLTLYEGGVLIARDAALRNAMRATSAKIVPARFFKEAQRLVQLFGYALLYRPGMLRLPYGIPLRAAVKRGNVIDAVGDNFTSDIPLHRVGRVRRAVGANASIRLAPFLQRSSEQAAVRRKQIEAVPGFTVAGDREGVRGTWPFLMVLTPSERVRDAVLADLWTAGLGVSRLFIHALPDYPYLTAAIGQPQVPNARDFASRMFTISNSAWLRDEDFDRILSVLRSVA